MPRLVGPAELQERRAKMPDDHPRQVAAAWRDGCRARTRLRLAYPDPWLWEDCPATLAAYLAGYRGEPRPRVEP